MSIVNSIQYIIYTTIPNKGTNCIYCINNCRYMYIYIYVQTGTSKKKNKKRYNNIKNTILNTIKK